MNRESLQSEEVYEGEGTEGFPRITKLKIVMKKHFTKSQSEFIMQVASRCMNGRKISWRLVEQFFMSDGTNLEMIQKIKNHYYNKRSEPARVSTRSTNREMSFLGLEI